MKKSISIILFITLLFGLLGFSFQEKTAELITGQKWASLSPDSKIGYLIGFEEGLIIAQTAVIIERNDAGNEKAVLALLDRIEKWIEAYEVDGAFLEHKVKAADDIFKKDEYKSLMVAAVLPLVSRRVRGDIDGDELNQRLQKLWDVLK